MTTTSSPLSIEPNTHTLFLELQPTDNERLINLCGQFDRHFKQIEEKLHVEIKNRGYQFNITGQAGNAQATINILQDLYRATANETLTPDMVHLYIRQAGVFDETNDSASVTNSATDNNSASANNKNFGKNNALNFPDVRIRTKRKVIRGRGVNQNDYIRSIQTHDLAFGVGPAGTGKTYLAVACAVEALDRDEVRRIILVRPAVEAGERLGFLPGDLSQKIDPYLRPMYDALYEFMGIEKVTKLIEKNVIEVAPLAYMRGRTLNDAFIIMDEAQNTTMEQMKMFLTRLGFGSTAVVTGDITQIDLPSHQTSGLKHVIDVLCDIKEINFTHFASKDVVRHALVQRIVEAYEGT